MGRVVLVGASAVIAFIVSGCGGSTIGTTGEGRPTGSGGAPGADGFGGGTGGTGGSVSPGKASIEFTVTGGPYCGAHCGIGPSIGITDPSGKPVPLETSCSDVPCGTCMESPCPPSACPNVGINVTGATLDWDGSYYAPMTCGSGTPCLEPTFASPGRYTATFCATPGRLVGPDGGVQQCLTSVSQKCNSVEFDFPSSTVVRGTVGP